MCHAYQIVSAHGVPDDHIIVMMYDDIAKNTENPTPGMYQLYIQCKSIHPLSHGTFVMLKIWHILYLACKNLNAITNLMTSCRLFLISAMT